MYRKIRQYVRGRFFELFRKALATDDGRDAVLGALPSRSLGRHGEALTLRLESPPYADLAHNRPSVDHSRGRQPLFITARFRSGSTLLWRIFREHPGFTAYYEPFNERRWFHPDHRGVGTDPSHIGVSDCWREYEGMKHLDGLFRERWVDRDLYMAGHHWDPEMTCYIRELVRSAPGRPVLQFNRVDFRLAWLRRQFPEATILHLYRHPRDQWCSTLYDSTGCPLNSELRHFEPFDHFYLLRWASDLKLAFPILALDPHDHPYRLFYLLWRLSYLFGVAFSHHTFSFEELVTTPDATLGKLADAVQVGRCDVESAKALIVKPRLGRWRDYADEVWFSRHEAACEELLEEFLTEAH